MLVDRNALVVSTISQLYFHEQAADPFHYPEWLRAVFRRHTDAMRADFEKSLEAGVRYALGTDLIGYPTHPNDMAAKEFELAVEWGMDAMGAIVAGTSTSAEALSMERAIGTIEPGKLADFIAFTGDPLRDISVLQRVEFVMQDGEVVVDRTWSAPAVERGDSPSA
jgi:imidazolonepropionase-like amidohydrolase